MWALCARSEERRLLMQAVALARANFEAMEAADGAAQPELPSACQRGPGGWDAELAVPETGGVVVFGG